MGKASNLFTKLVKRTNQLPRNISRFIKLHPDYKSRMENVAFFKARAVAMNGGKLSKDLMNAFNEANIKLKNTPKKAKVYATAIAQGLAVPAAASAGTLCAMKVIRDRKKST